MELYRIRFKDGIRAADSRLVWATSKESAEALGTQYCEVRGWRFVGAECETVAREGEPLSPAPEAEATVIKPGPRPIADKPPATAYTQALK